VGCTVILILYCLPRIWRREEQEEVEEEEGVVHMDCVRDTCISAVQYRGLSGPHVPGKSFSVGGRGEKAQPRDGITSGLTDRWRDGWMEAG